MVSKQKQLILKILKKKVKFDSVVNIRPIPAAGLQRPCRLSKDIGRIWAHEEDEEEECGIDSIEDVIDEYWDEIICDYEEVDFEDWDDDGYIIVMRDVPVIAEHVEQKIKTRALRAQDGRANRLLFNHRCRSTDVGTLQHRVNKRWGRSGRRGVSPADSFESLILGDRSD